ncbi:hypothetical protein ACFLT7_04250 [candidate division KSB1 bacterium]
MLLLCPIILTVPSLSQDQYEFDLSEIEKQIEKKPYSLGGFLEFEPVLLGLDRDAALYKFRFFDRDEGSVTERYDNTIRLEGRYQRWSAEFYGRAEGRLRYDFSGWDAQTVLQAGYFSIKPKPGLSFEAGKRVVRWGTGYVFNPVGFIQRQKDPENPEEALEGFSVLTADWIKSLNGPVRTLSLTTVVLPVIGSINDDFGRSDALNFALKFYMLLWDTDIDFIMFAGDSRTGRYGFDFAKNLSSNLEIHGEFARINNSVGMSLDETGNLFVKKDDISSSILGFRYLSGGRTTYIAEYFHDGSGTDEESPANYFKLINQAYDLFLDNGDPSPLRDAGSLSSGAFSRPLPGRDYLYFRVSQKEPFDILYFNPALTSIINIRDHSFSLFPELLYSPFTNLELRFRTVFLIGGVGTGFGEKQTNWRVELRARHFFQS